jgi:hypothetical protein
MRLFNYVFKLTGILLFSISLINAQNWITSTSPQRNSYTGKSGNPITVTITTALDPKTVKASGIQLTGSISGIIPLSDISYNEATKTITFTPTKSYSSGEKLTVSFYKNILTTSGSPILSSSIQFWAQNLSTSNYYRDTTTIISLPNTISSYPIDFNSDGSTDLAVNDALGNIFLYKNLGHKTFVKVNTLSAEYMSYYSGKVVAGDFNSDSTIDYAIVNKWGLFDVFTKTILGYQKKEFPIYVAGMNTTEMINIEQADFNNDGYTDFVVPNGNLMVNSDLAWASSSVVVINNRNGTFTNHAITTGGGGYGTIASGDIDNDGDIDLAISNVHNGQPFTISILKNDGNGNFIKTQTIIAEDGSRAFTFANIDGDEDLDFAFTTGGRYLEFPSAMYLYKNDGVGNFSSFGKGIQVQFQPTDLRACDFNGDGLIDFLATNFYMNTISLIYNTGSSYTVKTISTRPDPFVTAPADFDNDGDLDIVVASNNGVQIIWNESIHISPRTYDFGILPWNKSDSLKIVVHNHDAVKLASLHSISLKNPGFSVLSYPSSIPPNDSGTVLIKFSPTSANMYNDTLLLTYANRETVSFAIPLQGTSQPIFSLNPIPNSITSDTNVSIKIGIALSFSTEVLSKSSIAVHGSISGSHSGNFSSYNSATKELTFDPSTPFFPGERVRVSLTTKLKDKNGDSLATPISWEFDIKTYSGSGTFTSSNTVVASGWSYRTLTGDFNGDGFADIVNINGSNCFVFLNNGSGVFTQNSSVTIDGNSSQGCVGDINNDGYLDFVVSLGYSQAVQCFVNNGKGEFVAKPKQMTSPYSAIYFELADMNLDGFLDIAAVNDYGNILIAFNDQTGLFTVQNIFGNSRYTNKLCLADIDGDHDLDIVASAEGELVFFVNNGLGNLSVIKRDTLLITASCLTTADFNNDGKPDIAVGQGGSNYESFFTLLNNDNFSFTKKYFGKTGKGTSFISARDFDSDGDIDIAVKNYATPTLDIYTNTNNGDFSGVVKSYSASSESDFVAADFNSDGAVDIGLHNVDPQKPNTILRNRRTSATILITPLSAQFGKTVINKTVFKNVRVYNESSISPLHVTATVLHEKAFSVSPNNFTIDPFDSIDVLITFLPVEGKLYADSILFTSNDPINPSLKISLGGEGVSKPGIPVLLFPSDTAAYVPTSIILDWQDVPNASAYHLQIYKGSLAGPLVEDISSLFISKKRIDSLEYLTSYVWRVSALNVAGEGMFSELRTFTTFKKGPSNLKITFENNSTVAVSWNKLQDATITKYILYKGNSPDSLTRVDSVSSIAETNFIKNVPIGKIFYYAVSGIDTNNHETDHSVIVKYGIPFFGLQQQLGSENQTMWDAAWGDFDNDNDLDLITTGYIDNERRTLLYKNQNNSLILVWSFARGTFNNIVEWGDFDGDGDLDILHGNYNENVPPFGTVIEIYLNNGPGTSSYWNFTKLDTVLTGEYPGWIDIDNDGDLDIMTGNNPSLFYKNDGPVPNNKWNFSKIDPNLSYVMWRSFGDFNNDGIMDIGDVGLTNDLRILQNKGNGRLQTIFTDPGYGYSQGAQSKWVDMNNDGKLDFCVNGGNNSNAMVRIYYNSGPSGLLWNFTRSVIPNSTYENGKLFVGDINNDGWNDLLYSGIYSGGQKSILLQNQKDKTFSTVVSGIDSTLLSAAMIAGDYTNDGCLDVAIMPYNSTVKIYKNILPSFQTSLSPPTNLVSTIHGDTVYLSWKQLHDTSQSVTYNVYVKSSNGHFVISPNSNIQTGFRKIVSNGNAGTSSFAMVKLSTQDRYTWAIQSVSGIYQGSAFSKPDTFAFIQTSVEEKNKYLPEQYFLGQNFPNPFNPSTTIRYGLPAASHVIITVYNTLGQKITELINREQFQGWHEISWNANVASGIYFYRIQAVSSNDPTQKFIQFKKMLFLK